jgi:VWFA-related protein
MTNPDYSNLPSSLPVTSAKDEGKVTFSVRSELVVVPVVVTDGKNHLRGLKKEDFSVFENGKEQTISSFEEVTTDSSPVQRLQSEQDQFKNVFTGSPGARRVTLIVLDEVNTPFMDQAYARGQLVKYLSQHLQASDLVSLITMNWKGMRVIHDFSSDPAILIAALNKVSGSLPQLTDQERAVQGATSNSPFINRPIARLSPATIDSDATALTDFVQEADRSAVNYRQAAAIEATLACFLQLAQAYQGVPGRKSLVWLTGGFPFTLTDQNSLPGSGLGALYERAMQLMNQANIAVYPVDAAGLVNFGYSATAPLTARGRVTANINRVWLQGDVHATLADFAQMTGGRAFYDRNDLDTGISQASQDSSHYYVLGYYLDQKDRSPGWRKLKVKVRRDGAHILARNGFFVTPATMNAEASKRYDIREALFSPLDATALPVAVKWMEISHDGGKQRVAFLIGTPGKNIGIDPANHNRVSVEVAAIVKKPDGTQVDGISRDLNADLKSDAIDNFTKTLLTHQDQFELKSGDYTVKFVMRDNLTGKLGSVVAPLKVP